MGIWLALLFIGALFLPPRYDYRWSVEIDDRPEKVYSTVADFSSWQHWHLWLWHGRDPQAKFEISGNPGEPGHVLTWDGPRMGKGEFRIVGVQWPSEVTILMEDNQLFHLEHQFIIEPLRRGRSSLTWRGVSGDLGYPLDRLLWLFSKGSIEPVFINSLENLKNSYLEKE